MLPALMLDCEYETARVARFIRRELARAGRQRVILGLSGGIDSALTCLLCARALGAEAVVAMALPHARSSPSSEQDARLLADQLGVTLTRYEITGMVDAVERAYPGLSDHRRGNLMARARMMVLYDQFGQQTRIRFSNMRINPSIPAATFRFEAPPGVDVIRP